LIVEQHFPTHDQLDAAGVPGWVPRSSDESDGVYYVWSTGSSVAGRLFVKPGADRASTIRRLVERLEEAGKEADRDAPRPKDVNQPVAVVKARAGAADGDGGGAGYGSLGRSPSELRPLRDMLAFGLEDLRRSGSEDAEE
jgi:hypothetical protein